ncbi:GNAT family N-acetyltransferase [uncultured Sphingomonas sp.]|uniref:GNAT family N-acetyltransferase n=1 Tax=uncultured Sphingomonas sp. TaxID=158754 RepID=UPI0035CBB1B2
MSDLSIRPAAAHDLVPLQALIQRSYRGDTSRTGWTHEADFLDGERIGLAELEAMAADPAERLLILWDGEEPIGSVRVAQTRGDLAYLGQLCVDPSRQADGLGRQLIAAAEAMARDDFDARRIEMTVIEQRTELIAYYARRGYVPTGEVRPFPVAFDAPLTLVVLEKPLA